MRNLARGIGSSHGGTGAARQFAQALLAWYDAGHRALPWRDTRSPYAIWVSEVMLQQTRAETVARYYARFLERFPTIQALADAPEEALLKAWEGMGYYARARNLRSAARRIMAEHGGALPGAAKDLERLPGIGAYTAGAIASMAFGRRAAAVDGNAERVLARAGGIREEVSIPSVRRALWALAEELLPERRAGDFNNALIELGARVCVPGTPDCGRCPVAALCDARAAGDADLLPVKRRARERRVEPRGVAIVRRMDDVLVQRRASERLLGGLWQFPNALDAQQPEALLRALRAQGIRARWVRDAGEARHVFTHIVWEMRLHLCAAEGSGPSAAGFLWAGAPALEALPWPTAMRSAKEAALKWLNDEVTA